MAALSDPDPQVRGRAVFDIRAHGSDGLRAVPRLLAIFRDPDRSIVSGARFAVSDLGEAVVPLLQRIRSTGPGRLRAAGSWTATLTARPAAARTAGCS